MRLRATWIERRVFPQTRDKEQFRRAENSRGKTEQFKHSRVDETRDVIRKDCQNVEAHPEFVDFSTGPGRVQAEPSFGCRLMAMDLAGCPAQCPHFAHA